jgi:hypothetical protein
LVNSFSFSLATVASFDRPLELPIRWNSCVDLRSLRRRLDGYFPSVADRPHSTSRPNLRFGFFIARFSKALHLLSLAPPLDFDVTITTAEQTDLGS